MLVGGLFCVEVGELLCTVTAVLPFLFLYSYCRRRRPRRRGRNGRG